MSERRSSHETTVITGIGLIASVGMDRESVWRAVCEGRSGVRSLTGILAIPDHTMIGAPVDIEPEYPGQLKVYTLSHRAAREALEDAAVDWSTIDRDRFGCAISGQFGHPGWLLERVNLGHLIGPDEVHWSQQWLPNTGCAQIANRYGLYGPRLSHSTACASGLVEVLAAVRAIQDDQCDIALAGSAEGIAPLFAAGFQAMRVLANHEDPTQASRPFDRQRTGFVMGEGAAMFVVERLSHALERGARIYAEIAGGKLMSAAHHVTSVDAESDALARVISATLHEARMRPDDVEYVNAHGTGTQQNDVAETRGIRQAFGPVADRILVSSTKSMLGHLVNAAGSVELAITALAMRDGFVPPTVNLTDPDPECDLDCIPLVGRRREFENALKLSVAFGGHLAAIALRRWNESAAGAGYADRAAA